MIDPNHVPGIDPEEVVARYIFARSHIRSSDNSVKSEAFMPPTDLEMSVTRHLDAIESEIWQIGVEVARISERKLVGRADIAVWECHGVQLLVEQAAIPSNPNHAHIKGWPSDKSAQKSIAQQLASKASFAYAPSSDNASRRG